MIALFSTFRPPAFDRSEIVGRFKAAEPAYRTVAGLVHKSFWLDEAAAEAGGIYLFRDRRSLEDFLGSQRWQVAVPAAWGVAPSTRILEVPVWVDGDGQHRQSR